MLSGSKTLLNDLDMSMSHLERLIHDQSENPSIGQHFMDHEQGEVKKTVSSLSTLTAKFKSTLRVSSTLITYSVLRNILTLQLGWN